MLSSFWITWKSLNEAGGFSLFLRVNQDELSFQEIHDLEKIEIISSVENANDAF